MPCRAHRDCPQKFIQLRILVRLNERVRQALASDLSSILTTPAAFNSSTTTGSLGETEADKYALRLAALAQPGSGNASAALLITNGIFRNDGSRL